MSFRIDTVVGCLVVALHFNSYLAAQGSNKGWNFDTDSTGSIAKGFTNEVGNWKVEARH